MTAREVDLLKRDSGPVCLALPVMRILGCLALANVASAAFLVVLSSLLPVQGHILRNQVLCSALVLAPARGLGLLELAFACVATQEEATGVRHVQGGIIGIDDLVQVATEHLLIDQLSHIVGYPQRRVAPGDWPLIPWALVDLLPGRGGAVW